MFIWTFVKDSH